MNTLICIKYAVNIPPILSACQKKEFITLITNLYPYYPYHTKKVSGRWTAKEHEIFLTGLKEHGKGWKKIAEMILTRNVVQVRTHAQKYFQKLERSKLTTNRSITENIPATTAPTAALESVSVSASASDVPANKDLAAVKKKRKLNKCAIDTSSPTKKGKKNASSMSLELPVDKLLTINLEGARKEGSLIGTPSPTSVAEDATMSVPKISLSQEPVLDDWLVTGNDLLDDVFKTDVADCDPRFKVCSTSSCIDYLHAVPAAPCEYDLASFDDDTFVKGILEIFDM